MAVKKITAADLFCGAGGTSTGLGMAAGLLGRRLDLVAVNHWPRAVETHAANHPAAAHFCQSLVDLDPRKAVPSGRLDLLVASPECTHHSVARGGRPVNDQSRASAWCVLRWCTALDVGRVLIENVPEFVTWGPIGSNGRPLLRKKGETFGAFVKALESLGYRVEWRVLNAADFGGATTRRRLFLQAAKGRRPIRWPEPTHEPDPKPGLFCPRKRWRAAREVIDWSLAGESIFTRKRPLSANTLRRIEAGLRKFGGRRADPFLVLLRRHADGRSLDLPAPTLTAGGEHVALCEPFILPPEGIHRGNAPRSPDDPLQTITAGRGGGYLAEPFLMHTTHHGDGRVYPTDQPIPCVTGANRGEQAIVQPFIVPANYGERAGQAPRTHSLGDPLPTVVGSNAHALVEPFIVPQMSSNGPRSVDGPAPTITTTSRGVGLCEPFLVPFYANGAADPVGDPLRTVTARDRFGLATPDGCRLDIRFRMLQPHELARAMGFPDGYRITGNRSEQVRQIGNAVEVNQARELCRAMLEDAA